MCAVEPGEVVEGRGGVGVLGAQRLLADRQRPLVQRLGLGVRPGGDGRAKARLFSTVAVSGCSGPSAFSRIAKRSMVQRLGLGVGTGGVVELGEVVEHGGGVGVLGAQRLLPDRQRPLVERLGLGVGTGGVVEPGEVVERGRRCRGARGPAPSP